MDEQPGPGDAAAEAGAGAGGELRHPGGAAPRPASHPAQHEASPGAEASRSTRDNPEGDANRTVSAGVAGRAVTATPVTAASTATIHAPSLEDPLVAAAATRLGGPVGRYARAAARSLVWPLRVLIIFATTTHLLGYIMRWPCRVADFTNRDRYPRLCYSDIPYLYGGRGFDVGAIPYIDHPPGKEVLEYPVLTGWFMHLAGLLTGGTHEGARTELVRAARFYDWNAVMLGACLVVAVVATALTVRTRPWDAALLALAPTIVTTGLINWDLFAVALLAVSTLLWMRERPALAGVFLGLAVSAKFYPVVLLAVLAALCLRTRRLPDFARLLATALGSWAAVNVPIAWLAPDAWAHFYVFSRVRGADFGSVWLGLQYALGFTVAPENLNTAVIIVFAVLAAGVLVLCLAAPTAPRYPQVAFLMIAAFCVANKVYSPQYVLWLVPFAVLARPRWRDFLIWQGSQVLYAVSVWMFLEGSAGDGPRKGLNAEGYGWLIFITIAFTLWYCALIVRDILQPEHDPVRAGTDRHDVDVSRPTQSLITD